MCRKAGRLKDSERIYLRSVEIRQKAPSKRLDVYNRALVESLLGLHKVYKQQGRKGDDVKLMKKVVTLMGGIGGANDEMLVPYLESYRDSLRTAGRRQEVEQVNKQIKVILSDENLKKQPWLQPPLDKD